MSEKLIRLSNLSMTFEDGETILDGINLYINNKEFLTLLGPSGCGKTTTLRIIGGFLTPTSGDVFFNGQRINDVPPYKRRVNTVFQKYALFPHLNVQENIAFGLKIAKVPRDEIKKRVDHMLDLVNLSSYGKRSVDQLSGGQQQRVALARIMAYKPDVILLDEPFSALDMYLKDRLQQELQELFEDYEGTVIMVSHSRDEVYRFSEELLIIDQGQIVAAGKTKELFQNPLHPYTQGLLSCIPHLGVKKGEPLPVIEGSVPPLSKVPVGCHFCTRCKMADQHCMEHEPPACEVAPGHVVKCWKYAESGKQEV